MRGNAGILIEACCTSYRAARHAESLGADIIEICENLAEGGTTPSAGTVARLAEDLSIPLFAVIRPRGGDFVHSNSEFDIMKKDIVHYIAGQVGVTAVHGAGIL